MSRPEELPSIMSGAAARPARAPSLTAGADAATPGSTVLTGAAGAIPLRTAAVLDAISRAILTGELPPGRSLVEADLATALGVSKTPVREALKTLAGAGLVTMSPYRGAAVRAIDDATARNIYDMRLLLEPEAVRRAVARTRGAGTRTALARAGLARTGLAPGWAGPCRRRDRGRPRGARAGGCRARPGRAQPGQPRVPPRPVPGLR